ncbi:MAG TPA: 50S ribosomal protein L24 [Thermoanaerobaculia bacterium]|nr:50S ribosomal protein L24 [Thermoanaerobaculia bacterium]HQR67832.1 50S ribosomal protein L24 [Thermoanaerobaculia bacterium]
MKKKKPVFTGKLRIRRGDVVLVTAGKDRGASGKVLRVLPAKGRVIVEGVNKIKRATRANPQKNIKGGILEREAPIAVANVQLKDPETGKATRIGVRTEGEERVRFAKRSGVTVSAVTAASGE